MATSPFDSHLYRDLMHDGEVGKLFSDSAEVRAMMIVEGALAKAQADVGLIPETAAAAIQRASMEIQIDPGALCAETGKNAVPVPAFVRLFREEMNAPEHAQFLHYGATSQDIMDTALMLRMRQVLAILDERLGSILAGLAELAETHAATPMAGRTYGQTATLTSFGAVVASWGWPLIKLRARLEALQAEVLVVSLSGAAGTLSTMGDSGAAVRSGFAAGLGLGEQLGSWHSDRSSIAGLAGWLTQVTTTLGKMGEDLILLTQSDTGEIALGGTGASSTMPQKQNPVQPSVLVALGRTSVGLNSVIQGAAMARQQRDGAAWMSEWMTLPQVCMACAKATSIAQGLTKSMQPIPAKMMANADDGRGLIYAEALSFVLAKNMARPDAQAQVKAFCARVQAGDGSLHELATAAFPDVELTPAFDPKEQLGLAPSEARNFAKAARA
jgi:3-carboxy-cis,cis-muconate cycloisomerase